MWHCNKAMKAVLQKPRIKHFLTFCVLCLHTTRLIELFQARRDRKTFKIGKQTFTEINRKQLPSAAGILLLPRPLLIDEESRMQKLFSRGSKKIKPTEDGKKNAIFKEILYSHLHSDLFCEPKSHRTGLQSRLAHSSPLCTVSIVSCTRRCINSGTENIG